jgi:hypothetical protein
VAFDRLTRIAVEGIVSPRLTSSSLGVYNCNGRLRDVKPRISQLLASPGDVDNDQELFAKPGCSPDNGFEPAEKNLLAA